MAKITVYSKDGQQLYELDESKEIARGGEGILLPIPRKKDLIAKIYHAGCNTITEKKFDYLSKLDSTIFVRPLELLYDNAKKKSIVGITMNFLPPDFYPLECIFNKNFCLKNNISIILKASIANKLVTALTIAHRSDINIGDFSGLNIMMNNDGEIKFIDVDSYEVPGVKHTNKLLEDIRDNLYGGNVSSNSDFFALSVVVFNSLTYLHPFKGIHKRVPKMSERMIKKLPVFVKDKDLIIPKCYEELKDNFLQTQFERLYLKGERFLLAIDKIIPLVVGKKIQPQTIQENDVMLHCFLNNVQIEYVFFNNNQGMIRTKDDYLIYDSTLRGTMFLKATLKRTEWLDVFVGEKNIILTKENKLYNFDKSTGQYELINNFNINPKARFVQSGKFLIMIEEESLYHLDLDEVKYNTIKYTRQSAFGPSFTTHSGMIQNVGGTYYLHYSSQKSVSVAKSPFAIRGAYGIRDVGIVQYVEKGETKFKFYNISDSNLTLYHETENLSHIAYRGENSKSETSLVFQPADNTINVLRAMDFHQIAEIKCSVASSDSRLYNTGSGLLIINEDQAWLINKN